MIKEQLKQLWREVKKGEAPVSGYWDDASLVLEIAGNKYELNPLEFVKLGKQAEILDFEMLEPTRRGQQVKVYINMPDGSVVTTSLDRFIYYVILGQIEFEGGPLLDMNTVYRAAAAQYLLNALTNYQRLTSEHVVYGKQDLDALPAIERAIYEEARKKKVPE